MLLRVEGLGKSFAARRLFRDVSLHVEAGDRIALIGANGTGKTTLLRILVGLETADEGRVLKPRATRLGLLRQEIDPGGEASVFADVVSGAFPSLERLESELHELEERISSRGRDGREVDARLAHRYDESRAAFAREGGFEREARTERVLEGLGFDAEARARPLSSFSGGWQMRVELAKLLLQAPDVLLLDEPTNHLDLPAIEWFDDFIGGYPGAVVLISHDRVLLRRHARRIAALESGRLQLFNGGYDAYLAERERLREGLAARRRAQAREVAQTERFVERFRAKASKARQVQSRIKALERMERIEVEPEPGRGMRLRIPAAPRSGRIALRLLGIRKSFGELSVYRDAELSLERGERVALVGANGLGKTTLLRIAAGELALDAGTRQLGANVQLAFYAQHQLEVLDPEHTVLEELDRVARVEDVPRLRSHLGAFLFSGDDIDKRVGVLSGGEKARLALARLLLRPANLLILDEPTGHLDVQARQVIEDALADFGGTLLFVSHDREFIRALATRVVDIQAGALRSFPGSFEDYRAKLAAWAERPAPAPGAAGPDAPRGPSASMSEGARATLGRRERIEAREAAKRRTGEQARARRGLVTLEQRIHGLEVRRDAALVELADPARHADGDAIRALESERRELETQLGELLAEWERAAEELERLSGDGD